MLKNHSHLRNAAVSFIAHILITIPVFFLTQYAAWTKRGSVAYEISLFLILTAAIFSVYVFAGIKYLKPDSSTFAVWWLSLALYAVGIVNVVIYRISVPGTGFEPYVFLNPVYTLAQSLLDEMKVIFNDFSLRANMTSAYILLLSTPFLPSAGLWLGMIIKKRATLKVYKSINQQNINKEGHYD